MNDFQKNIDLLHTYYDKIYLITIDRNISERLEKVNKELQGLQFEIFKGVDGKLLSKEEKDILYNHEQSVSYMFNYHKFRYNFENNLGLNDSEIGCAISHLNIYKDMISNNYKKVLILEDDVRLNRDAIQNISKVIQQMPVDADFMYWGYRWNDCESLLSQAKRKYFTPLQLLLQGKSIKEYVKNNRLSYPKRYSKNVWNAGYHAGAYAYAISQSTAQKVISINEPIVFASDAAINYLVTNKKIKAYVSVPIIFSADHVIPSSIF